MNNVGVTELEKEEEFIQQWVDLEERLKAPAGKYKLVLIDRFEPLFEGDTTIGIFDTLEEAMKARAGEEGEPNDSPPHSLIEFIIYNGEGHVVEDSSFAYSVRQKRLRKLKGNEPQYPY